VAIADVFAAFTAPRAYRPALSCDEAHALLREGRATQFDPRLIDLFSGVFPDAAAALAAADAASAAEGAGLAATLPNAARRAWTEIREASQEARSAAFTDALTGLANARHLAAALPRELEATQRSGGSLSVLMIDLDGFKAINDGHGHLQGDAALQTVACLLRQCVRDGTTVCRYAGDEFVLVLPGTTREQASRVADRLRERVDGCRVPGTELRIGLSIGIASFPEDGGEARALLDAADRQMYADKSSRKCRSSSPPGQPANIG
jgi:diguanylate cyclase (GGDEF)-like protein